MKKILIVSVEPVMPNTHGGVVRTLAIATQLAKTCEILILSPDSAATATRHETEGRIRLVTVPMKRPAPFAGRANLQPRLGYVHFRPLRKQLAGLLEGFSPDVVIWSHSYLAYSGQKFVSKRTSSAVQVVDFANIEFLRLRSMARNMSLSIRKLGLVVEVIKARVWESRVAKMADLSITVSEKDDQMFAKLYGRKALLVPNGSSNSKFHPGTAHELTLLSVANWDYHPNVKGLFQFLEVEWPKIIEQWPRAQLVICGKSSERVEREVPSKINLLFKGYVPDLSQEYQECTAALAPATTGGGSQLKVIEAVSHGRPVIGPEFLGGSFAGKEFENCVFPTTDYIASIKLILDNPKSINENCFKVGQRYTWGQICLPLIARIC